jgi:hypothetical protein
LTGLSPLAQEAARDAGLTPICQNPFKSIVVRSVEILYACDEALRIIAQYEPPERPAIDIPVRAASGCSCTGMRRAVFCITAIAWTNKALSWMRRLCRQHHRIRKSS